MGKNEDPVARNARQRRHREKMKEAGLTAVTVTVPIDKVDDIKTRAAELVAAQTKEDNRE